MHQVINEASVNYIRSIKILTQLRDNLDKIPLKMNSFGTIKAKPHFDLSENTYEEYVSAIGENNIKTAHCCLAGYIPVVDKEWADNYYWNELLMAVGLAEALVFDKEEYKPLYNWLFNSAWNNNKEFAKFRLNMVIENKQFYIIPRDEIHKFRHEEDVIEYANSFKGS